MDSKVNKSTDSKVNKSMVSKVNKSTDSKVNKSGYLSKRGYVLRKNEFSDEELLNIKLELRGRPLSDSKYASVNADTTYPVYLDTKSKLYIPKMYGIEKFGFPETVTEYFEGKEWEHPIEFKGTLYDHQIEPVNTLINNCHEKFGGILTLPTGFGKCMKIDTPIIMYDGTIKMVQDIQVGDLLMGDDSTPRKVLSLARGIDDMYDIIPVKGDKYTVNKEHILVLKNTKKEAWIRNRLSNNTFDVIWWENNNENSKTFNNETDAHLFLEKIKDKHQQFTEIEVKNYIKQSNNFKHHFKGYRVPVEFPHIDLEIDPYMIGIWLGDGTASQPEITTQDSTIIKYFKENLQQYKCYLQYESNNELKYRINGNGTGNKGCNYFLNILKKYDLINNKHIPHIFKCNSRSNQLKLLAGLLDSDGSYYRGVYEFSQSLEHEQIIDDVVFLCRSLGFACYKNKKSTSWQHNGVKNYGDAWRIIISGSGLEEIPVLCKRKKAEPRKQIKDALVTGIKVKYVNKDEYYGFTIDGNHRYLLSDFTVTHNTISLLYVLSKLKGKTIIIVNKIPLMNQWISEINKFLPNAKVGIIQGQKNVDVNDCDIVVAMLQSMARIDYPDELFRDFRITVCDEVHNTASKVFSQILFKLCCKYTVGLSATPKRSDGCEYVFKWHLGDIVYETKSERKGKPPIIRYLKIDSKDYKEITTENKFTGQKQIQFTSMLSDLVDMTKRNGLIVDLIKDLIKKDNGRKLLVLSDRRTHLQTIQSLLDGDLEITFTYGLFLGGMKQKDLEKGRACQVILATYQAFGEGVSEKDLDTLLLITPKKFIGHLKNTTKNESGKLEQIVGRIFRKEHIERNPLIIDFYDNFSVYKSQAAQRKNFYKQHFNNSINEEWSINLDDVNKGNGKLIDSTSYISFIKIKKKKEAVDNKNLSNSIMQYCILDD
jgi:hypothetical protein